MSATKPKEGEAVIALKTVKPDSIIAPIVGRQAAPRIIMTRKLWAYIKKNPKLIVPDAKLKPVLGGRREVTMYELEKLASEHLT